MNDNNPSGALRDFRYACHHFGIPDYMIEGLERYVFHGVRPGGFLSALLSNDFMDACHRADDNNLGALVRYARLFHNRLPMMSYGSAANFEAWIRHKGLEFAPEPEKENAHNEEN